ncbi:MAG: hypothetical protein ACRECM_12640 [Methyloceanibacter sp.]
MGEAPPDDTMERLRLEAQAEQAYSAMYEARPGSDLAARYSDAKEFLHDAIGLAHRLGQAEEAEHLTQRLMEIKTVVRRQFPA